MSTTTIDFDARYRVRDMPGVAFYLRGHYSEPDEDTIWSGVENVDSSFVRAVMVGDDREHIVDVDDLELLGEDTYCPGCGQIGCGHHA